VTSPSIGYSPTINPVVSRPSVAPQRSAPVSTAASTILGAIPSRDAGLSRQVVAAQSGGGLPRSTIALLESLQAGSLTSALLSSLASRPERAFSSTSPLALMLNGQSAPLGPNGALLESLHAGRQTATLLSSLTSPTVSLGPLPSFATRVDAAFGNRPAEVALAEQLIRANGVREPSVEGRSSAQRAYIQELQAHLGSGPELLGSEWPHEWFA
jgi:hypothetical protein